MSRWFLSKQFRFEAAHQLPDHDGKCKRLHGHSWVGYVEVSGARLHESGSKSGMLVDFADLKSIISDMVDEYLDHHFLNDALEMRSPTSELIAQWCYNYLALRIDGGVIYLESVRIEETCTSACTYKPVP